MEDDENKSEDQANTEASSGEESQAEATAEENPQENAAPLEREQGESEEISGESNAVDQKETGEKAEQGIDGTDQADGTGNEESD